MTLFISILALILSVAALSWPIIDKNLRNAYKYSKNYSGVKYYQKSSGHYGFYKIPLCWIGTAYHLRNGLMDSATHSLDMYYLEQKEVKEAIFYVSLKDFQSISTGQHKLLIEDPFGEVWTHFTDISRTFIENNLDKIIRIEAEIVSKESQDGISLFHPDSKMKNVIHPLKIESTGVPTLIIDVNDR